MLLASLPPLRRVVALLLALLLAVSLAVTAGASDAAAQDSPDFTDLDQTVHAEAIRLVAEDGITRGYPDGTFRPRDDVRRDQMASFLRAALQLDPRPADFPDVTADSVHAEAIGAIAHAEITRGFPDGTYRPLGFVTRGQMATFLAIGLDLPPGDASFTDVPDGYVHAEAIAALAASGITEGYGDGTFRPNLLVKRDQMAAFLARGIPLPRVVDPCVPTARASSSSASDAGPTSSAVVDSAPALEGTSEDLTELELGDRLEAPADVAASAVQAASTTTFGAAVPGIDFPITSAIRAASGALEVHSQDLPSTSRGVRVAADGEVVGTTTVPRGTRTWATAQVGEWIYVGQWGTDARHGSPNLFRYRDAPNARDRTAQQVAAVPSGNEFWTLAADGQDRLWAGTRAHANGEFRQEVQLGTRWTDDPRHVVHRITTDGRVTNVFFCTPNVPADHSGTRPDIKQIAAAGSTLYVGTGQQAGSTRLYAFEPGDRDLVPIDDVRDLTPANVRGAQSIFALHADERWLAFGTQAASGQPVRVVVIDRRTEQVRANVALPASETRVEAVAIRGDRVVAAGFPSGELHSVDVPSSGSIATTATRIETPVPDQFSRMVEIDPDGGLRGVTNRGLVWLRDPSGEIEVQVVLGADDRVPGAPGLPHSLHAGPSDVAVGANGAVILRDATDPSAEPRTAGIAGEAKAITSAPDGTTFAAAYPNAMLWRVEPGGDRAEQVTGWTREFTRPADADHDPVSDRVLVVARHEADARSESRPDPWSNFQYRPSRLFAIDAGAEPSVSRVDGTALTRADGTPVEARTVLAGPSGEVYVGDTRGGVQRLDPSGAGFTRTWYADAATADRYRPVVGLDLVDDRLVAVISGVPARTGDVPSDRTVIRELTPGDGTQLAYHVVTTAGGTHFAVPDAVTTGNVTVMPSRTVVRYFDRDEPRYWSTSHRRNFSFGGPYASLNDDCELYTFVGDSDAAAPSYSELARTVLDVGGCAPVVDPPIEPPIDPPLP